MYARDELKSGYVGLQCLGFNQELHQQLCTAASNKASQNKGKEGVG